MKYNFTVLLFLLFVAIGSQKAQAQLNYSLNISNLSSFPALSNPDSTLPSAPSPDDDVYRTVILPFDFVFNGQTYRSITPNTNGMIFLGNVGYPDIGNLSGSRVGTQSIVGMGGDLVEGSISVKTEGINPNRTFTIQYNSYTLFTEDGVVTFQVKLHETTNIINFIYGSCTSSGDNSLVVGISGLNSNEIQSLNTINNWNIARLVNNESGTMPFTDVIAPGPGLMYTFTPPLAPDYDLALNGFINFPNENVGFCDSSLFQNIGVRIFNRGTQTNNNPAVNITIFDGNNNVINTFSLNTNQNLPYQTEDTVYIPPFLLTSIDSYSITSSLAERDDLDNNNRLSNTIRIGRNCTRVNYSINKSIGIYEDRSGGTELSTPLLDDDQGLDRVIPIPFAFEYAGRRVSNIYISNSGFINLDGVILNSPNNVLSENTNILAPFASQLIPNTDGSVTYQTLGMAPNRQFIIQYKNMASNINGVLDNSVNLNFQIILNENQTITYAYGNCSIGLNTNISVGLGLSGPSRGVYNQYLFPTTGANWLELELTPYGNQTLPITIGYIMPTGLNLTFSPNIIYNRDIKLSAFTRIVPGESYCNGGISDVGVVIVNNGRQNIANANIDIRIINSVGTIVYARTLNSSRVLQTFQSDTLLLNLGNELSRLDNYSFIALVNGNDENRANDSLNYSVDLTLQCNRLNFITSISNEPYQTLTTPDQILADFSNYQNNQFINITLPFTFRYPNVLIRGLNVFYNGYVSFDPRNLSPSQSPLALNANVIAPFGMNMTFGSSSTIRIKTVGIAPNRTTIIEWKNMIGGYLFDSDSTSRITFQLQLFENGVIKYAYDTVSISNSRRSAQIGLNSISTSNFIIFGLPNGTSNLNGLVATRRSSADNIIITRTTSITSGRTITFVPPALPSTDIMVYRFLNLPDNTVCDSTTLDSVKIVVLNLGGTAIPSSSYRFQIKNSIGNVILGSTLVSERSLGFGELDTLSIPAFTLYNNGKFNISVHLITSNAVTFNDTLSSELNIENCGFAPYIFTSSTTPYESLTGGQFINYSFGASEGYAELALPRQFVFNGRPYNSVFLHVNGFLSFGQGYLNTAESNLFENSNYKNIVMGFNANLNCIGRSCYSRFDVASQDFIIEYSGFIDGNNSNNVKLQYRLKSDNSIVIKYDTINRNGLDNSFRAFTGIKINDRTFTVLSNINFPYSWTNPELNRNINSGNHYSSFYDDRIPNGLTYTWTPTAGLVRDIALINASRIDSVVCGNLTTPLSIKIKNEGGEVLSSATIQFTTFKNDSLISTQNIPISFNPMAPGDSNNIMVNNLNLTSPGTYNLVLEALVSQDDNNNNNRISLSTIINPSSTTTPIITSLGNTAICQGSEVVLTSAPANYYLWSNGATTRSIAVSLAGNYTVQTANNIYCLSAPSASIAVSYLAPVARPTITANGPTSFCFPTPVSVQLTSSALHRNLWSTGDTSRSITVSAAGSYSVITQGTICSSLPSDTILISYFERPAIPTILTSGPTSFCLGSTVILSAPAAEYYRWNNGATTRSITVDSSGSFFVETANYANCFGPASLPVNLTLDGSATTPTITALGNTEVCANDTVVLRGPNGMAAYIWSTGETTESIRVYNSGDYTLQTIPIARGCISPVSEPVTVTVAEIGEPPIISSSNDEIFCEGDSTVLSIDEIGTRIWSTGDTTETLAVRVTGEYSVMVISAAGCTSEISEPIFITVNPRPQAPRITIFRGTLIASGMYDTYIWYQDGVEIIGADANQFTPTVNGDYTVQGVSDICNSQISAPFIFNAVKGAIQYGVSVYPNPATNSVYISAAKQYDGKIEFGIYNALGQQVLSKIIELKALETNAIDISGLPVGMYHYKMVLPVGIQQDAFIIKR